MISKPQSRINTTLINCVPGPVRHNTPGTTIIRKYILIDEYIEYITPVDIPHFGPFFNLGWYLSKCLWRIWKICVHLAHCHYNYSLLEPCMVLTRRFIATECSTGLQILLFTLLSKWCKAGLLVWLFILYVTYYFNVNDWCQDIPCQTSLRGMLLRSLMMSTLALWMAWCRLTPIYYRN